MHINNTHLTYCTNIHSGESWDEHFSALKEYFPAIKKHISPDKPMGMGLRLSHIASLELTKKENLDTFKDWLDGQSAYVFTMNGFPYGGFHHTRVKDQVHAPDWTTNERVEYTIRLFDILTELLPEGMEGGISTSPLTYRHWFNEIDETLSNAKEKATANILKVLNKLIKIKQDTCSTLHLDIEPEPDGLLETGAEFISWFDDYLLPAAITSVTARFGVGVEEAELMIRDHIRLCYDVCHFAIGYESHADIVSQLIDKGIKIGKVQVSAALKAELSDKIEERKDLYQTFSEFNESTYLHQVVARKANGSFIRYPDLPEALEDIGNLDVQEWRAHFHVPVFVEDFSGLLSTRSDITQVLTLQNEHFITSHLEVETYTWEVLPEALKLPLQASIIRELEWVKSQLTNDL